MHFSTRQPKHTVMAVLVAVALEQLPEVERRVKGE